MIKELAVKLKQSELSKSKVENLYRGAEEQIKILQEEKDRLNINVKELTEYIQRKEHDDKVKDKEKIQEKKVCRFVWKEKNRYNNNNYNEISKENENKTEQMYNCNECSFQSTISSSLSKHINLKHKTNEEQSNDVFRCVDCDLQFSEKWNLMDHRINNHKITEVIFPERKMQIQST